MMQKKQRWFTVLLSISCVVNDLQCQQDSYQKGQAEFFAGNYKAAIENLSLVKEEAPGLNYLVAMSYFNLKKFSEAIPYFDKEISRNSNNLNAYIQKASAQHQAGSDKEAVLSLKKALEADSAYYVAYFQLGELKYDNKDYAEAIKDYEKAVELHSQFERAFYKLGFCFYNLKNNNKACEWWKKIEDPDDFKDYKLIEQTCNKHE